MEEEKQEVDVGLKTEDNVYNVQISKNGILIFIPIFVMCLYVIYEILLHFGVFSYAFSGIASIFLYILPLGGVVLSYLKDRKASFEFWLNVGTFAIIALTI